MTNIQNDGCTSLYEGPGNIKTTCRSANMIINYLLNSSDGLCLRSLSGKLLLFDLVLISLLFDWQPGPAFQVKSEWEKGRKRNFQEDKEWARLGPGGNVEIWRIICTTTFALFDDV